MMLHTSEKSIDYYHAYEPPSEVYHNQSQSHTFAAKQDSRGDVMSEPTLEEPLRPTGAREPPLDFTPSGTDGGAWCHITEAGWTKGYVGREALEWAEFQVLCRRSRRRSSRGCKARSPAFPISPIERGNGQAVTGYMWGVNQGRSRSRVPGSG